jgi:catechol 2,3-dioxygenase-like lactoylglutathione lyase family enzyme
VRLDNVRLLTGDLPACLRFYADGLGLRLLFGGPEEAYAELAAGSASIALFSAEAMAAAVDDASALPPTGDAAVIVLSTDDLDATVAGLRERGLQPTDARDRGEWGIRTSHLRDPDGRLVELYAELRPEGPGQH